MLLLQQARLHQRRTMPDIMQANKAVDGNGRINPNTNPEINNLTSTDNNAGSDRWLVSRNYLCFKNLNIVTLFRKDGQQRSTFPLSVSYSRPRTYTSGRPVKV